MMHEAEAVLTFWFEELTPEQHWAKDDALDAEIGQRFANLHARAVAGECWQWRAGMRGRLAEIIVLDQFSRNLFRDQAASFAADPMALALAQEAVATGRGVELAPTMRRFLYMPYMHSESLLIHDQALQLFSEPGLETNLDFEQQHRAIIARFGRYPHRNAILGRASTAEEEAFLQEPGSSF